MKIKKLTTIRGLYFYNAQGEVSYFNPETVVAISEKPLPERSWGLCSHNQPRLINLKRRKRFEIAILDPIFPGVCVYITDKTTYMPKRISVMARQDKRAEGEKWLTFQRADGSLLFVMDRHTCLAKDVLPKKK